MSELSDLYGSLARSASDLDPRLQVRIHRYAMRTRNEDLAAALARRSDTIAEVDAELGGWSTAKVQAAWFSRPGRSPADTVSKVRKERRVTVLEVVAGLEALPPEIYKICADRDSHRVATPLVTNQDAPVEDRRRAAATLSRELERMSYSRKHAMMGTLSACESSVVGAFIQASADTSAIIMALKSASEVDQAAAQHVVDVCASCVDGLVDKRERRLQRSQNVRHYASWHELANDIRQCREALELLGEMHQLGELELTALVAAADKVNAEIGSSTTREDREIQDGLSNLLAQLSRSAVIGTNPATEALATTSRDRLLEILENNRKDRSTALAALCNPVADPQVARQAISIFSWAEPLRMLEARHREMNCATKAVVMVRAYQFKDDAIRKFASPATPKELWSALVKECFETRPTAVSEILGSAYASVDVVPELPLQIFRSGELPDWVATELAKYLCEHLDTDEVWDGFEVLAPKHLGGLGKVVRAASLTARHSRQD
jgi:hypothetical protein